METSFTELRNKEVINVLSGRLLGNINDIIIDLTHNCVLGLVVPNCRSFWNFFRPPQEIFIPYTSICKIGEDVILVEVVETPRKRESARPVRIFDAGETAKESENDKNQFEKK
jgi:YlmC/YmxH family sporulation protein